MVMPSCSALKGKMSWRVRGLEVARFVEDIVGGEKHFALLEENFAVGDQGGGIGDGLAGVVLASPTKPTSDGSGMDLARRDQFLLVAFDEGRGARRDLAAGSRRGRVRRRRRVRRRGIWLRRASSRMRSELPSKSPTVGLNWARAIFMRGGWSARWASFCGPRVR